MTGSIPIKDVPRPPPTIADNPLYTKLTLTRGFGWRPQFPDQRDFNFRLLPVPPSVPTRTDLRSLCPPVYDQGGVGSCVANAIAADFQFVRKKENKPDDFLPSRLFIYWLQRYLEGTVQYDAGSGVRDGMKVVNGWGACPEVLWPYDDTPVNATTNAWNTWDKPRLQPTPLTFSAAGKKRVIIYYAVSQTLADMKACLASGYPFVFGFSVYDSFVLPQVEATGIIALPAKTERVLGGHSCMIVGHDDATKMFLVRNSWGTEWGLHGYCLMPYDYILNPGLAADFWTIRLVM